MSARLPLRWALARSPLTRIWPASCHLRGINRISLHILTCSPKCCFESTAHQKVTLNPWYPGRLYTTDACAQARGAVTLCNNPTLPSPNARLRRVRQRQHVLQRHLARQQHALAQHAHHEVAHLRAQTGQPSSWLSPTRALGCVLTSSADCSANCNSGVRAVLFAHSTASHTPPHTKDIPPRILQCWHVSPPCARPRHHLSR